MPCDEAFYRLMKDEHYKEKLQDFILQKYELALRQENNGKFLADNNDKMQYTDFFEKLVNIKFKKTA